MKGLLKISCIFVILLTTLTSCNTTEFTINVAEKEGSAEIRGEFVKLFEAYAGFSLPDYFVIPEKATIHNQDGTLGVFLSDFPMKAEDVEAIIDFVKENSTWGFKESKRIAGNYYLKKQDSDDFPPKNRIHLEFELDESDRYKMHLDGYFESNLTESNSNDSKIVC